MAKFLPIFPNAANFLANFPVAAGYENRQIGGNYYFWQYWIQNFYKTNAIFYRVLIFKQLDFYSNTRNLKK